MHACTHALPVQKSVIILHLQQPQKPSVPRGHPTQPTNQERTTQTKRPNPQSTTAPSGHETESGERLLPPADLKRADQKGRRTGTVQYGVHCNLQLARWGAELTRYF
ncbi:uncharacterized protein BO97DRAFT_153188 [Aspergillus homomorphus CBS 101889]|uniref:Uncharacterized protein n=1 Tax=Aspergillus homomorphus (strain CBS 101889) TaxID=1450537 RepID=A0A395HPN7_ASPHC|nr:hypothetical protein BO97DRAFT_153188 [Aspergillus homomorphus CBS 101889]RAL09787.1 hypothetical protein BO97DRAFT_153188 [Aspergillus homomorphus CBS 101889]